jgi:hypothetical protein
LNAITRAERCLCRSTSVRPSLSPIPSFHPTSYPSYNPTNRIIVHDHNPITTPHRSHDTLNKHPLTPPFDKLIQHKTHIREHKATDIKPEKLSRMARGKFQPHVRLRAVLEPWVLDLARDLVYETKLAKENR